MKGRDHFEGKKAWAHVAERQAEGFLASKEVHGLEVPGHLNAGLDAARDMATSLLILFALGVSTQILSLYALGLIIWKTGRAAWLGWGRLERLHRVLAQERWEIEHNRPQEREELVVLYGAKGFEGKLLNDVVDVLMADESRLLRVMIEEEMGLTLENTEHPLKQAMGAFIGTLISALLSLLSLPIVPIVLIGATSGYTAYKSGNRPLDATVWAVAIALLATCTAYFIHDYLNI